MQRIFKVSKGKKYMINVPSYSDFSYAGPADAGGGGGEPATTTTTTTATPPVEAGDIADIVSWWDISQLVGYVDNDAITTWNDEVGSFNLTPATTGFTYKENIQNSLPAALAGGKRMLSTNFVWAPPFSFSVVLRCSNAENDYAVAIASDTLSPLFVFGTYTVNNPDIWQIYTTGRFSIAPAEKNTWLAIVAIVNGSSSKVIINGTEYTGIVPSSNWSGICVGAQSNSANDFLGYYGEIATWHKALSDSDASDLCSGLMTKWGITI